MSGAPSRSRARVAFPRDLFRATKTIRAPIFASATATTSPIPDVPPVMTTVFPHIRALVCLTDGMSAAFAIALPPSILMSVLPRKRTSAHCQRALESLQKVQVVTIRVFETDHTGAPGLVLRRIIELHTSLSQCRIQRINICHGQADVIDARWIAEQAQLPSHRRRIVLLRREYEQVYGTCCHHHAAVVSVRFRETQFPVEPDQPFDVGCAHAYVVDTLYHCRLSVGGIFTGYCERPYQR